MSVSIKSEHEIELMREAGHLLEKVHNELAAHIRPGISTKELDLSLIHILTKKVNVKVNAVSETAKAKIEAAGGTVEVI